MAGWPSWMVWGPGRGALGVLGGLGVWGVGLWDLGVVPVCAVGVDRAGSWGGGLGVALGCSSGSLPRGGGGGASVCSGDGVWGGGCCLWGGSWRRTVRACPSSRGLAGGREGCCGCPCPALGLACCAGLGGGALRLGVGWTCHLGRAHVGRASWRGSPVGSVGPIRLPRLPGRSVRARPFARAVLMVGGFVAG